MRKIILLIISSLIISCENMNDNQPAKIVFLGDSITQQAEDLEDGFIRHSSNSLAHLLKLVGFKKVDILVNAYKPSMTIMNIVLKAKK